eukprot:jgi/Botrbrau1/12404/Bobra.0229s0002.1
MDKHQQPSDGLTRSGFAQDQRVTRACRVSEGPVGWEEITGVVGKHGTNGGLVCSFPGIHIILLDHLRVDDHGGVLQKHQFILRDLAPSNKFWLPCDWTSLLHRREREASIYFG